MKCRYQGQQLHVIPFCFILFWFTYMEEVWPPVWKCCHGSSRYLKAQNWGTEAPLISHLAGLAQSEGENGCHQDHSALVVAGSADISGLGLALRASVLLCGQLDFHVPAKMAENGWVNVQEGSSHPPFLFVIWSFSGFYENTMSSLRPGSCF